MLPILALILSAVQLRDAAAVRYSGASAQLQQNEVPVNASTATAGLRQAPVNASTATADLRQAPVDVSTATADLRQAPVDVSTATADLRQAPVDVSTATADLRQEEGLPAVDWTSEEYWLYRRRCMTGDKVEELYFRLIRVLECKKQKLNETSSELMDECTGKVLASRPSTGVQPSVHLWAYALPAEGGGKHKHDITHVNMAFADNDSVEHTTEMMTNEGLDGMPAFLWYEDETAFAKGKRSCDELLHGAAAAGLEVRLSTKTNKMDVSWSGIHPVAGIVDLTRKYEAELNIADVAASGA
eukprot:TRINITY_DN17822_c0_g1_i2.p1 TRINITY_DN17822_c0_g1~~TRINITY_DN17822_c0_g1_i2.p1  ORF type:complete len:300 (-),score=52.00 TRINITY_DN17822_c0_g1_i2:162-1061(-)